MVGRLQPVAERDLPPPAAVSAPHCHRASSVSGATVTAPVPNADTAPVSSVDAARVNARCAIIRVTSGAAANAGISIVVSVGPASRVVPSTIGANSGRAVAIATIAVRVPTVSTAIAIASMCAVAAISTSVGAIPSPKTSDMRDSGAMKAASTVPAPAERASVCRHVKQNESHKCSNGNDETVHGMRSWLEGTMHHGCRGAAARVQ